MGKREGEGRGEKRKRKRKRKGGEEEKKENYLLSLPILKSPSARLIVCYVLSVSLSLLLLFCAVLDGGMGATDRLQIRRSPLIPIWPSHHLPGR